MARVVLDSSVLIALLSESDSHHDAAKKATTIKHQYSISAITLSEVLIAPFRHSPKVASATQQAITQSIEQIVAIDSTIASLGASIRANTKISLPDALISATASSLNAQLWTCDRALAKAHKGSILIS